MVFDFTTYNPTLHAKEQAINRVPEVNSGNVEKLLTRLTEKGKILIDIVDNNGKKYRYIRSGLYFIPCVSDEGENNFSIISILTWDMVLRSDTEVLALQSRINRYHH